MASFVPHMDCSSYEQCDLSFVPIHHPCVSLVSPKPLLHPSFSHLVHIVIPNTHTIYHQNKCPTQHVVESLNYIGVSACTTNGYITILTLIHVCLFIEFLIWSLYVPSSSISWAWVSNIIKAFHIGFPWLRL
jgi:hypothetical protein